MIELTERILEFLTESKSRGLYHVAGSGNRPYQADPFEKRELKYLLSPEKEFKGEFKLKKQQGFHVYSFKNSSDAEDFATMLDAMPKTVKVDQSGSVVKVYRITRQQ